MVSIEIGTLDNIHVLISLARVHVCTSHVLFLIAEGVLRRRRTGSRTISPAETATRHIIDTARSTANNDDCSRNECIAHS